MSPFSLTNILLVASGGAIGCLLRYYFQEVNFFHADEYYFTVGINITGCCMMGILWALFDHFGVATGWRLFLLTGVLGGYTTYSAFTLDALLLLHDSLTLRFLFYVAMTFAGGLLGCAAGLYGTEKLLKIFG